MRAACPWCYLILPSKRERYRHMETCTVRRCAVCDRVLVAGSCPAGHSQADRARAMQP